MLGDDSKPSHHLDMCQDLPTTTKCLLPCRGDSWPFWAGLSATPSSQMQNSCSSQGCLMTWPRQRRCQPQAWAQDRQVTAPWDLSGTNYRPNASTCSALLCRSILRQRPHHLPSVQQKDLFPLSPCTSFPCLRDTSLWRMSSAPPPLVWLPAGREGRVWL